MRAYLVGAALSGVLLVSVGVVSLISKQNAIASIIFLVVGLFVAVSNSYFLWVKQIDRGEDDN